MNLYEIPSPAFLLIIKKHIVNLQSNCRQGSETFALVEKILYVQPLTVTKRNRRFIGEIALLLSGFSFYEVQQLSSEVDQVKQNQKHLIAAVSGLTRIMRNVASHLEDMDNYIRGFKRDIDVLHFELYIEYIWPH